MKGFGGIFDTLKVHLKALPSPCPLACSILILRLFKWANIQFLISRDIKTIKIWGLDFSFYLTKTAFFTSLWICLLIHGMPLKVECHVLPHFKALDSGFENTSGHGHGCTFCFTFIGSKYLQITS